MKIELLECQVCGRRFTRKEFVNGRCPKCREKLIKSTDNKMELDDREKD